MLRRRFVSLSLSSLAVAAASSGLSPVARAQNSDDPGKFIQEFAQRAIVEILQANIPHADKTQRFRTLFVQDFDIPAIARFVLGRFWRVATPEQQQGFLTAFDDVIVYTWARRFSEYNGQTLQVDTTAPDGSDGSVVNSTIVDKQNGNTAVAWRLRKRDTGLKVVDVVVAGVSMAITYRQEYADTIAQKGGMPGLIAQLQSQAEQLKHEQG
jgi:phospholipid transport system substrate-binding protein